MKSYLFILMLALCVVTAELGPVDAAETALQPLYYTYSLPPDWDGYGAHGPVANLHDDSQQALMRGTPDVFAAWSSDYSYRGTDVEVVLPGMCRISRVVLTCVRKAAEDGLNPVTLYVSSGGDFRSLGQQPGLANDAAVGPHEVVFGSLNVEAERLRLHCSSPGALKLWKVEVYGKPLRIPDSTYSGCSVTESGDAKNRKVVLENGLIRATFEPDRGGVLSSLVDKRTGKELAAADGLVPDVLAANRETESQGRSGDWTSGRCQYEMAVMRKDADYIVLRFWAKGVTSPGTDFWTQIAKTVVMRRDSASLSVEWQIRCMAGLWRPLLVQPWFPEHLNAPAGGTIFEPQYDGVAQIGIHPNSARLESRNPSRGWTALVRNDGAGCGFETDYLPLANLIHEVRSDGTVELGWNQAVQKIAPGETLRTGCVIQPLMGLKRVDGIRSGIATGILVSEISGRNPRYAVKVQLLSDTPRTVQLLVKRRALSEPETAWKTVGSRTPSVGPRAVQDFSFEYDLKPTDQVLRVLLLTGKQTTVLAERVVRLPGSRITYTAESQGPSIGRSPDPIQKPFTPGLTVPSPFIAWAKPLASGPLKVLFIMPWNNQREAVELGQRLDMTYRVITLDKPQSLNWATHSFFPDTLDVPTQQKAVLKALDENWDVCVIGGVEFNIFGPEVEAKLVERMHSGMGLLYASPAVSDRAKDKLPAFLPLVAEGTSNWAPGGAWRAVRDHYISSGLAYPAMPRAGAYNYHSTGETLVSSQVNDKDDFPVVVVGEAGSGRVVCLSYCGVYNMNSLTGGGLTPFMTDPELLDATGDYWEHYYQLLARAVVWAGRHEGAVRVVSAGTDVDSIPVGKLSDSKVGFRLHNEGAMLRGCQAEFTLRSNNGGANISQLSKRTELPGGDSILDASLPAQLPAGRYLMDLIVRDSLGRSVSWATATFQVVQPTWIASVETPDAVAAVAKIPVKVNLGGAMPPAGTALLLELWDTYDRLLLTREIPVKSMQINATFDPPTAIARIHRVRAELRDGKTVLSTRQAQLVRTPARKPWDTYQCVMFDASLSEAGTRAYLLRKGIYPTLKDCGVTAMCNVHRWYVPEEVRLQVEMNFEPMVFGIHQENAFAAPEAQANYEKTGDIKYLYRNKTMTDPQYLKDTQAEVHKIADIYAKYTPLGYMVGDEQSATSYNTPCDYDFSPTALESFRTWLRERYITLEALNSQWGTSFSDWKNVVPETSFQAKARKDGNYSSWTDHRSFMEWSFANVYAKTKEYLHEKDPGAPLGLSGTQAVEAYGGFDLSILAPQFDYFFAYSHANLGDIQRSFTHPGTQMSDSLGYYTHNPAQESYMWRASLWGWQYNYYWMTPLLVLPDYRPSLTLVELDKATRDLRMGLSDVLMTANRQHDGIALHYSMPSVHTAWITGFANVAYGDNASPFAIARNGWVNLLDESRVAFNFVSSDQITDGMLEKGGYKVLVMPLSIAIGDEEAAEIRKFVQAGGTVIADLGPGLYDGHGRRREQGALDDVFGIERDGPVVPFEARSLSDSSSQCALLTGCRTQWLDSHVRTAKGAEAAGKDGVSGAPLYVRHRFGKGMAHLCNTLWLNDYMTDLDNTIMQTSADRVQARHDVFGSWLSQAGAHPSVKLSAAEPGPLFYTRQAQFKDGKALYIGIGRYWGYNYGRLRDSAGKNDDRTRHLVAKLPITSHLYDARAHKYLGVTDTAEFDLRSSEARYFALWPYQLKAVILRSNSGKVRLGDTVKLDCKLDTGGIAPVRHVVRFDVLDPLGRPRPEYGRKVRSTNGTFSLGIPIALNDPAGKWRVRATEVVSGLTQLAEIQVSH